MVGVEIPLQAGSGRALPIAGTFVSLALFLSLTAYIAARNVLGDVSARNALLVGPVPAVIAVIATALDAPAFLAVPLAVVADALVIGYVYRPGRRLTAYITLIHVVVSIILGVVLFALLTLAFSAPG
ncbi:MAG: DUF7473 family protein [Halobacteriota archaeon]